MFLVVSGGSGSGKSAYAEDRVLSFGQMQRIYIATMQVYGEEGKARVERHRKLRSGKGFHTIERPLNLDTLDLDAELLKMTGAVSDLEDVRMAASDLENDCMGENIRGTLEPGKKKYRTVLLECMSNLAANEMFDPAGNGEQMFVKIERGIDRLLKQCDNLVVVTNEVFSDGITYDPETVRYCKLLGEINCMLAQKADEVTEVVCGIPIQHKADGGQIGDRR